MLLIPAIDLKDGKCVRLKQGDMLKATVYSDDPVSVARRWVDAGARRLHIVDLDGASDGRPVNSVIIHEIADSCPDVPIQVGGGIRSEEDIVELLNWGVRHLILGTVALEQPELITSWVKKWGSTSFVISLDLKKKKLQEDMEK